MERVITVEYLQPSMSRDLLCKFPDTSPFDFDYNQSGIWSPLLPRHTHSIMTSTDCFPSAGKRRKVGGDGSEKMLQEKLKKAGRKIQKAMKMAISNSNKKKKKKKKQSFDFSPTPVQGSVSRKQGWSKVLRAATKRFKKHKGSSLQLKKLPTF